MNDSYLRNSVLAGRVILITGAGAGLGSVAAKACAAAGACVVLLDKAVNRLEEVHDEIVTAGSIQPALYPLDLGKADAGDYAQLSNIIEEQFGVLHGLLHSAVELGQPGPLGDIEQSQMEALLRVNLTAAHALTRALLPLMQRSEDASMLFTSDSSARLGKAYWGAYGVAKIALEGMARMWAEELESAGCVRVNVFAPGPVNSPLRRRSHPGEPPERIPPMEHMASRYVYLLGPESRGIHGRIIEGPG